MDAYHERPRFHGNPEEFQRELKHLEEVSCVRARSSSCRDLFYLSRMKTTYEAPPIHTLISVRMRATANKGPGN